MRNFVLGALSALILAPVATLTYAALGFVAVNADSQPSAGEGWIMRRAIHASVRHRAPEDAGATPSDSLVIAGGRRYLNDCVGCHGEPGKPPSQFGALFYPPAPQFPSAGTAYTQA